MATRTGRKLGELSFDRARFEPGWRWSVHAGADSCEERHLGYLISGRMRFRMEDGAEVEVGPAMSLIRPRHDSWVVGDEPCLALDIRQT
jgi:hypothetical protein